MAVVLGAMVPEISYRLRPRRKLSDCRAIPAPVGRVGLAALGDAGSLGSDRRRGGEELDPSRSRR
jgi:hypothetical protein